MANFFDQFDTVGAAAQAPAQAPAGGNFFDQFDVPSAGASSAPLKITVRPSSAASPDRSGWGNTPDAFIRGAADMLTLGGADELSAAGSAALNPIAGTGAAAPTFGQRYDQNVAQERAIDRADEQQQTIPRIAGQVTAALLMPGAAAVKLGSRLAAGAATGAAYGFGSGEDTESRLNNAATGAAIGGVAGAVAPLVVKPVQALAGAIAAPFKGGAPTVQALKNAAKAGYESPEVEALVVKPDALTNSVSSLMANLNAKGFDENIAPKTFGVLAKASTAPDGSFVTAKNLLSLRRTLGKAASSIDPSERAAARQAMSAVDELMTNMPKGAVISGDAKAASATIKEANANYSAAKHAELLDQKMIRAELRAAAANSGQNVPNTIRQRMADILLNDKQKRGFTKAELALMEKMVRGTVVQNTARFASHALGGGGGAWSAISGVATAGIAPAVGYTLRKLEGAITMRQARQLSEMIRGRAPLAGAIESVSKDWEKAARAFENGATASTYASLKIASRNLANNLASVGITVSPTQILRSAQGPSDATAGDEQK